MVITGPAQVEVAEVERPHATGDWALVRVVLAGLCTENKRFMDGGYDAFMGHEAVGEVAELGNACTGLEVGERVVVPALHACGRCALCQAGYYLHCEQTPDGIDAAAVQRATGQKEGAAVFAQYLLKPAWLLWKIPKDISYKHAAMANCGLGPTFGALLNMNAQAGQSVLITGLGGVGLGGVVNAKEQGLGVIALDTVPYRMQLAKELGADHVLDAKDTAVVEAVRALTGGIGPHMAIECSGALSAQKTCMRAVRRLGQVAFVGGSYGDTPIAITPELVVPGIRLIGSWMYPASRYGEVMQVIRNNTEKLDKMITHIVPLSGAQQAMELSAGPAHGKMLLDPWA